jgi:hypothetical protein
VLVGAEPPPAIAALRVRSLDCWNTPIKSAVLAGLRFSKVCPDEESTHCPST